MPRFPLGWSGMLLFSLALSGCGRGPLYERGVEALREGEDVAARAYLTKAISRHPGSSNNAQAYNLIGVACWRLGELEQARQSFQSSRDLDSTLAVAAYNLGVLNIAATNSAQAVALLHEAALLDPSDPRPLEYLAHLAAVDGRWEEAEDLLNQALERDPGSPRNLSALALTELHTRDAQAALARLGSAVDADQDYAPAYLNLAVISATRFGDDAEALAWLDKYLEVAGQDEPPEDVASWRAALVARVPPAPVTTNTVEQVRTERESPRRPEREPTGARQEDEGQEDEVARRRAAVPAYNRGTVAHAHKKWNTAIAEYGRALELDPSFDQARINLATALHESGNDRDAVLELQKVVSRNSGNARAHYLLGLIFSAQDQTRPEAEKHYRKFLELQPGDPAAERIRSWL